MSEREKMMAGLLYLPSDPELTEARMKNREILATIGQIPMREEGRRKALFRDLFGETGEKFLIENHFACDYGFNIFWGENTYANFNCVFLDSAPITLGENTMLGPGVMLMTVNHPLHFEERNTGREYAKPIHIGKNVWIGAGAIVNPGVNIGDNAVIGSGSVVVKDIPPDVVAVGNPCKVVKRITR
jgi:maltose O-acetyltransferase